LDMPSAINKEENVTLVLQTLTASEAMQSTSRCARRFLSAILYKHRKTMNESSLSKDHGEKFLTLHACRAIKHHVAPDRVKP